MMPQFPPLQPFPLGNSQEAIIEDHLHLGKMQRIRCDPIGPAGQCYWNVSKKIGAHGGSQTLGWLVAWWPNLFVQAIHHGVWKSPSAEFLDVTEFPGRIVYATIFIPDGS